VIGDTRVEPGETFTLQISAPSANAVIARAQGTATIVDDDSPVLSVGDVTVMEGNTGTTNATFTIYLSQVSAVPVTVTYTTADGIGPNGAVAGTNYTTASGAAVIPAGAASTTITVPVLGNTV